MRDVSVVLRRDSVIGDIDRRLFGAFVEHLGRCVYGGIYEPGHPSADAQRLPARRAGADARTRRHHRALSRRQLRLGLRLGGRRRAASSSGRAGSISPGSPPRPTRSAPTSSSTGAALARRRADARRQPRHARGRRRAAAARVLQPSRAAPRFRPARARTAASAARRQALVPRQRDGRAVADGDRRPRTNTAGSPPRPRR